MEALLVDGATPGGLEDDEEPDVTQGEDGSTSMRTNRNIMDDASAQQMTMAEIEELKQGTSGAGQEIISKLLESHTALDQKTEFSRAKYTLRKRKKYLRRFTALPLDVPIFTQWMLEQKDAGRILELRDEIMGLIGCLGNVHHGGGSLDPDASGPSPARGGRWLVIDDTPGLVTAAMAERMGILHPPEFVSEETEETEKLPEGSKDGQQTQPEASENIEPDTNQSIPDHSTQHPRHDHIPAMSATNTTLTVIHPNLQPNLAFLKYFSYDSNNPDETHPLYTHLKTLSWMQLLDPQSDSIYSKEPPIVPDDELATWKPSKRGIYYRKRRRWARVCSVINETRAGGFDGLIVASLMDPVSILRHTVPLLAGSAPVVVYSPHVEPLTKLVDFYSTARRTAFISHKRARLEIQEKQNSEQVNKNEEENEPRETTEGTDDNTALLDEEDFPVDPTLLLAPTIHTSRVRAWQALPGRTHPLMVGRGGAEGYVFHAIRVLPSEGKVEARGIPGRKKRKITVDTP